MYIFFVAFIHKEDIPVCSQKWSSSVFTKKIFQAVRELDPKSGDACFSKVLFPNILEELLCEHPGIFFFSNTLEGLSFIYIYIYRHADTNTNMYINEQIDNESNQYIYKYKYIYIYI